GLGRLQRSFGRIATTLTTDGLRQGLAACAVVDLPARDDTPVAGQSELSTELAERPQTDNFPKIASPARFRDGSYWPASFAIKKRGYTTITKPPQHWLSVEDKW